MKKTIVTVIIIIIAIALFILVRNFGTGLFNNDEKPYYSSKVVLPGDDEKIFSSLNGKPNESVTVFPDIPAEKVKELLRDIEIPESFCWYYTHTLNSSRTFVKESGIARFDVDSYKIEVYDESSHLKKTVIEDNSIVSVDINGNSKEFSSLFTDAFKEAGVPSLSDFLHSDSLDLKYSLVESEYGSLLYAEFVSHKNGYSQVEQYYISLDYGIIVRADCFENGILIYNLETNALYEVESTASLQ